MLNQFISALTIESSYILSPIKAETIIEPPTDTKDIVPLVEKQLKPSKKDSDSDDLSDADEIKYGANPNDNDSDDDGYLDGQEVENGYNPIGEGKLR